MPIFSTQPKAGKLLKFKVRIKIKYLLYQDRRLINIIKDLIQLEKALTNLKGMILFELGLNR